MDKELAESFIDQIESDFTMLEEENVQALLPDEVRPMDSMNLELIKKNRYHYNPFWEKRTASPGFLWANFQVARIESIRMMKKKIDGKLENAHKKSRKPKEIGELAAAVRDVDYGVFIQFYRAGVDSLLQLSTAERKVFSLICLQLMGPYGKDMLHVNVSWKQAQKMMAEEYRQSKHVAHEKYLQERKLMYSRSFMDCISIPENYMSYEVYKRGLRELREQTVEIFHKEKPLPKAKLLYKTKSNGCFLINPLIWFNGNRGQLVKSDGSVPDEKEDWIRNIWNDEVDMEDYLALLGQISTQWLPPGYKTLGDDHLAYDFSTKKVTYQASDRLVLQHVRVTKEQGKRISRGLFVKIYKEGLFPVFTLGKNGMLVLTDIFHAMLQNPSKDKVTVRYTDKWFYYKPGKSQKKESKTGRQAAFYKGLHECIDHSLICRSDTQDTYFINPLFFFVGDRLKLNVSSPGPEEEES